MLSIKSIKKDIIAVCRLMYEKGYISATDGNVSVRFQKHEMLITATGTHKGLLKEEDIIVTDLEGNRISGQKKPSSEIMMHLKVYEKCKGISAVIHAHPPICTAISLTNSSIPTTFTPEVYISFGRKIPVARYATPSTSEVPEAISEFLPDFKALLLARHGTLTMGKNLWDAFYRLEKMENAAHVFLLAKHLGGAEPIAEEKLKLLDQLFH